MGIRCESNSKKNSINLIVLDLNLPGNICNAAVRTSGRFKNGFLSSGEYIPVIMLTARVDSVDRILGLEMRADDYLPKPFEPRELLARIRSVLRRSAAQGRTNNKIQFLRFAGWTLNLIARHLIDPNEVVVMLSDVELSLYASYRKQRSI